ncbi:MAG: SAM-dependent methyltransferase [Ilumatobacteraceae bacterium]
MTERGHWFEELADHMGEAYLRYSFTKGTTQEVDYLVDALKLDPSISILDVGCGPGRHVVEFARRGYRVTGIDVSTTFIDIGRKRVVEEGLDSARFEVVDARDASTLVASVGVVDRAVCLCQGAFGVMREDGEDEAVLRSIASVLRPGGLLALSAFNAYFSVRHHHEADFDAELGISHERTEIRDPSGATREVSLWTGCYTPRELRLLLRATGYGEPSISSVEPGVYGNAPPTVDSPEFLVIAERL